MAVVATLVLLLLAAPLLAQIDPEQLGVREVVARGLGLRRGEATDPGGRRQSVAVVDAVDQGVAQPLFDRCFPPFGRRDLFLFRAGIPDLFRQGQ